MSNFNLDHSALARCLESLNHLFIDIARINREPGYEERRGGYCDLQVARLDSENPRGSKLVAAKKLLLGTRSSEPKRLAFRLARELKVWAGLCHPHILPLLGFYLGEDYKTAVLISEYIMHGDLKDYITKMMPSYDERLHLVRDLTDGLKYLHTQIAPVRHGDLKPGNVLVNLQRRAMLADFGLSKALNSGPTGFTTGNDARGTVRFSGPEVLLEGVAAESLANDIWSWGCLVLEAMTNEAPFRDIQPEAQLIVALIQGRTPCDTKNLALNLPEFSDLLVKCWSREPNQRPTAADCLGVIQSLLPSSASPSVAQRMSEQLSREPLAHSRTAQQQQPSLEQTVTPQSTQSSQTPEASAQVNQQHQIGPSTREGQPQRPLDDNAAGPPCDQAIQQIFQVNHIETAAKQTEAIVEHQPALASAQQPAPMSQGWPVTTGPTSQPQQPSSRLANGPEVLKRNPGDQKRTGLSDPVVPFTKFQRLMLYRHQQNRPMETHDQHAYGPLNPRGSTSQTALGKQPLPGLRLPTKSEPAMKPRPPPKPRPTQPTKTISPAEFTNTSRRQLKIISTKRGREDDMAGPDGSAGPSSSLKRARMDSQEDIESERTSDIAAAEQLAIDSSPDVVERRFKVPERVATTVSPTVASENGVTEQDGFEDPGFGETPDLAHTVSTQDPTPDAEGLWFWESIGILDGWYGWDAMKPEWDAESIGRWPIGEP